jgi:hypothetical protein
MAGQARSRGTRGTGRCSRAARSWPVLAAASADASGSSTGTTPGTLTASTASETSRDLATRPTYRNLMMRGLAPDEAANLTAFLSGIHVGAQTWKLREINDLLFLRELNRTGRFGATDGEDRIH